MSKLVKKLRQICEGGAQPMGFRAANISPDRQMSLIVSLPKFDIEKISSLSNTELDALVVCAYDMEKQPPQQFIDSLGDIPFGVWLEVITEQGIEQLKRVRGDFLIFQASKTPAVLLQEEELGKILKVDYSQDNDLMRTIDQLPIDVVLLDIKRKEKILSVTDLIYCQWLAGLSSNPLLVNIQDELTDKEIRALWEAGVNGIIVELPKEQPQEKLTKLANAIKSLPSAIKKRSETGAVLPRLEPDADLTSDDI